MNKRKWILLFVTKWNVNIINFERNFQLVYNKNKFLVLNIYTKKFACIVS